ncbi:MAG: 16S rRNA (uracil(1498)-N(3))-methyltransferase [Sulfuricellaceae bacterium]|nr:16S rRNA (uracil(1498)-N(3))-methyltransferase [Sulfuricellaceae bacterium]
MPISRFYCPQRLSPGQALDLPPDAAHHAAKVLRCEPGAGIVLFNGDGGEYEAVITYVDKNRVSAKTLVFNSRECESPIEVRLVQAISSGERMDFTLQKAVELGVSHIQPVSSERSIVKLSGERAEKRVQHWQNIVISACEQSGRNRVPGVAPISSIPNWLGNAPPGLRLLLSPAAELSLSGLDKPQDVVTLLIGPEGGLSPNEIEMALGCGFVPTRLGSRVLRTETAALAALAAMQALWGDF